MQFESERSQSQIAALSRVLDYHARTKHRLDRYAAGPETLDWEAQPAAFRRYSGSVHISLPLVSELDARDPAATALARAFTTGPLGARHTWTLTTLGVLLQASFGITAWKVYGPSRWALRANPSSGNLHPVEAYVIASQLPFLADGVYHYDSEQHALTLRAGWAAHTPQPRGLHVALTSVMWREAWKYGERAFRYCQLDVGHASAALAIAARLLGAEVTFDARITHAQLTQLLGLDREQDYPQTRQRSCEREEPELVLQVACDVAATHEPTWPSCAELEFHGQATLIDPRPMYRWPSVDEVAIATRTAATPSSAPVAVAAVAAAAVDMPPGSLRSTSGTELLLPPSSAHEPADTPTRDNDSGTAPTQRDIPCARSVLLGRRSAQRFDMHYQLPLEAFSAMLAPLLPSAAGPWRALQSAPAIDLVLFVHRVTGLESGLYYLPRRGADSGPLLEQLSRDYAPEAAKLAGSALPLVRLCSSEPKQLMRIARALHCHQDIAAMSSFALGMIAEFEPRLIGDPSQYRALFREAGLIGQLLYDHAEAQGVRGTGIGCYFDDAVHELLGLRSAQFQSLYHFTVGRAVEDTRLQTGPAYPERLA